MSSPPPPDPWPSQPQGPVPGDHAQQRPSPGEPSWDTLFAPDADDRLAYFRAPPAAPKLARRNYRLLIAGAAGLALVVVVGLVLWLTRSSSDTQNPSTTTTTAATPPTSESRPQDPAARERLLSALPSGYSPTACNPMPPPKDGVLATVSCDKNSDPGGPPSATYTLVRDKATLDAAFNDIVRASGRVNCPGNIQSPGPWRRNATPQKTSGTLFCGVSDRRPMVAWTDDAKLLVSSVRSGSRGPTFEQLYAWWSSHS